MTKKIENLDYANLDFDYINIHATRMYPSRVLMTAYNADLPLIANGILSNIIDSIENRYWLKWERIAAALFSQYDILKNVRATLASTKKKTSNDKFSEEEANIDNKTENKSDIKRISVSENGLDSTQESSTGNSNTSRNLSSQELEENGYYGFNSNVAAPATNATNSSGTIESNISNDSDTSETKTNRVSNSSTGEVFSSEKGEKNIKSRNLDNEREVNNNEIGSEEKEMQTLPAQELIMKEIELRKETLISIMFSDVDTVLCLSTF